jgi:CheY-like chemotaxis protein
MTVEKAALLIVEDDLIAAADLKRILKKAGHSVSGPVDNGRAALAAVKKVRPDLVLMDIKLKGGMDGNRAAEALTGYKRQELIGKNFFELNLLSKNQLSWLKKMWSRLASGHETGFHQYTLRKRYGIPVEIETMRSNGNRWKNRCTPNGSAPKNTSILHPSCFLF